MPLLNVRRRNGDAKNTLYVNCLRGREEKPDFVGMDSWRGNKNREKLVLLERSKFKPWRVLYLPTPVHAGCGRGAS